VKAKKKEKQEELHEIYHWSDRISAMMILVVVVVVVMILVP
jgi:hypothetical protein